MGADGYSAMISGEEELVRSEFIGKGAKDAATDWNNWALSTYLPVLYTFFS